jgi:hypothetical protein
VKTWQERRSSGKRGKSVNVERATLSGNMIFFFYKFPLFCDNMDNFVHNAANKTSEFLQYVVVPLIRLLVFGMVIGPVANCVPCSKYPVRSMGRVIWNPTVDQGLVPIHSRASLNHGHGRRRLLNHAEGWG